MSGGRNETQEWMKRLGKDGIIVNGKQMEWLCKEITWAESMGDMFYIHITIINIWK